MKKIITIILCLCLIPFTPSYRKDLSIKANDSSINSLMRLWYDEEATITPNESSGGEWMQQSLPLGNGDLGSLVFGGVKKERIHINQKTLWTGGPSSSRPNYNYGNKQTPYTSEAIEAYRQLLDDKSTNVFNDDPSLGGYGMGAQIKFPGENNLNKGSYQDFADIYLDFNAMKVSYDKVDNYYRDLNLQTGIASTYYTYEGVEYLRESFVSEPNQVMVTRLSASQANKLSLNVLLKLNNSNLSGTTSIDANKQMITIDGKVNDNNLKYRTSLKVIIKDGTIKTNNNTFDISEASEVILILAADTNYLNDYPTYRDENLDLTKEINALIDNASKLSYDELLANHLNDHQTLFDRVSFDLYDYNSEIPTDELVKAYRNGEYSNFLEILSFQFGRYLTIAGSRGELPSNLVGLWTIGPSAWTGDYHFNVNVQMNYWPVYSTNLAECGTTMVDYMENLREPGRVTAQYVHGISDAINNHTGFTVHTENNPFGMCAPTNAQEYGWNPTGAAWAIQNLWAHYEFTQDKTYLKEVIYPIMKEATLFWDNYLWESSYQKIHDENSIYNGQNKLVVAPSLSEEQGPTAIGTTYDQSLVWELYNEVIQAGEIIGEDEALLTKWKDTIQRLDPIEINETNGIKEWYEETRVGLNNGHHQSYAQAGNLNEIAVPNSGWNIGHPGEQRHASHLVGLYPGTLINKDNETYLDAAITSLTERGVYSTGWSKANKINLWARTGDGNQAYVLLNNLIGGNSAGLQYNLFDSHGSGGGETMKNGSCVWQIDGNYGLTSGVAEMLLQSQLGYVQFLPALPDAWNNGSINGLKARGNFTINQTWRNHQATSFEVTYEGSETSSLFTGEYSNIKDAKVYANGKEVKFNIINNNQISFEAKANVTYTIDMSNTNQASLINQANTLLNELDRDLVNIKALLQNAINNPTTLSDTLAKVTLINDIYVTNKAYEHDIYTISTNDGYDLASIDTMYLNIKQGFNDLRKGNKSLADYYQLKTLFTTYRTNFDTLNTKKALTINYTNKQLSITHDTDYQVRYALDEMVTSNSTLYNKPLANLKAKAIYVALYDNEQRVSKVYALNLNSSIAYFDQVNSSFTNIWSGYELSKMIDHDTTTRWASKGVNTNEDMIITLSLNHEVVMNALNIDAFVSNNNLLNAYEIKAKVNNEYISVAKGNKLANLDDKTSDLDGGSGGYHALKTITFDEVKTSEIKLILKAGYVGEPSIYEISYQNNSLDSLPKADFTTYQQVLSQAKQQDMQSSFLKDVDDIIKESFKYACSESINDNFNQSMVDAYTYFLNNHLQALGFKENDYTIINQSLSQAITALNQIQDVTKYESLLNEVVAAKLVVEDKTNHQPQIDLANKNLINSLKQNQLSKNDLLLNKDANSDFKVVSVTSQCGVNGSPSEGDAGGQIEKIFDYNNNTYWHSDYVSNAYMPQEITIDLNQAYILSAVDFLPRQNGTNGDIFAFTLLAGNDVNNLKEVQSFSFANNGKTLLERNMQEANLTTPIQARYLKIKITSSGGDVNNQYASMAELRIYGQSNKQQVIIKDVLAKAIDKAKQANFNGNELQLATEVLNNTNATQSDITTCTINLLMALSSNKLDTSKLEALINQYQAIDLTYKTDESVKGFKDALTKAQALLDHSNLTQSAIDQAYADLIKAYNQLQDKVYNGYDDVDDKAWFAGMVKEATLLDLMSSDGGGTTFNPNGNITRAMVATILHRMEGKPSVQYVSKFNDVAKGEWYSVSITWASNFGVVSGYKNGNFGPDDKITREDLAIMIRNYANKKGLNTKTTKSLAEFKDYKAVSSYASDAIAWCVENGIMSGSKQNDEIYLKPSSSATRAEGAKMFVQLFQLIKKQA